MTTVSGGPTHTNIEPIVAAGNPPISTVGTPGGIIGPPTCGTGVSQAIPLDKYAYHPHGRLALASLLS